MNAMENGHSAEELALMKRWVETWKFAGPELERIKREELRALTEEEGRRLAILVMDSRFRHARERQRNSSGLIEQQRIFSKGHCAARE